METSAFSSLPTGIPTLDDLLAAPTASKATSHQKPPHREPGFAYSPHAGFCGVIFGASNSGKSILSLELACKFVSGRKTENEKGSRFAVFVSQENLETVKCRINSSFGFLQLGQVGESLDDLDPNGASKLVLIHMPLKEKEQQERLIDTFELINSRFCYSNKEKSKRGGPDDDKERILIVLDNAETIRTEAYRQLIGATDDTKLDIRSESGRREFYKLLRDYCARHRIKAWFTFEEGDAQGNMDELPRVATAAETYAADAAIRLGMTVLDGNFRERSLEIIKARDQFYRRGPHHFSIRGLRSGGFSGPSATDDRTQTGIIIYPSLPTQLHRLAREGERDVDMRGGTRWRLGIDEIDDEIIHLNPITDGRGDGFLARGTVSVLVADLDSMGTDLALHFAAQMGRDPGDYMHWLYISLHNLPHMLQKIARRYAQTQNCENALRNLTQMPQESAGGTGRARCLFFPPEQISDSKLLHDIDTQIVALSKCNPGKPLRIVVDDLFALDKHFPLLRDKDDFVAALFELFRRRGATVLVVDTVEVGEGRNPLERSVAAGMADHVFLLRHIEFQTKTRKVFSVLKLAEFDEPSLYWEIDKQGDSISANAHRFQFFKGLLSGKPEPVEIRLSLYADSPGSPQHKHLKIQQEILSKTFGQHIDIYPCHADAYVALQQAVGQESLPVLGDCHIISVDEIWLDELIRDNRLKEFKDDEARSSRFEPWDETEFVSCAHDLACENNDKPTSGGDRRHFAIPDRHNCGVLTYYPHLSRRLRGSGKKILPVSGSSVPSWNTLAELQRSFVREQFAEHRFTGSFSPSCYREREPDVASNVVDESGPWGVFTFSMENRESCVSFLLELVLSQLKGQELVNPTGELFWDTQKRRPWRDALVLMLSLLDPWDIQRLADGWLRPCQNEHQRLYSRQWFTGWGALGLRFPGLRVMELPSREMRSKGKNKRKSESENRKSMTVSGTWYLAMLAESSAVNAGIALIRRLTSPDDELHRLNYGVALPVRTRIYADYAAHRNTSVISSLPYAEEFSDMHRLLESSRNKAGKPGNKKGCFHSALRESRCLFSRALIKNYQAVSPILMGLMAKIARRVVEINDDWLLSRETVVPPQAVTKLIEECVAQAAKDCKTVWADR